MKSQFGATGQGPLRQMQDHPFAHTGPTCSTIECTLASVHARYCSCRITILHSAHGSIIIRFDAALMRS